MQVIEVILSIFEITNKICTKMERKKINKSGFVNDLRQTSPRFRSQKSLIRDNKRIV